MVTTLYEAGFDNSKIQSVTGHRTSVSVDRYKPLRSDAAKLDGFNALSKRLRADSTKSNACEESGVLTPVKMPETPSDGFHGLQLETKSYAMDKKREVSNAKEGGSDGAEVKVENALRSVFGSCSIQHVHLHLNMK